MRFFETHAPLIKFRAGSPRQRQRSPKTCPTQSTLQKQKADERVEAHRHPRRAQLAPSSHARRRQPNESHPRSKPSPQTPPAEFAPRSLAIGREAPCARRAPSVWRGRPRRSRDLVSQRAQRARLLFTGVARDLVGVFGDFEHHDDELEVHATHHQIDQRGDRQHDQHA
jgi:hypothetical protein